MTDASFLGWWMFALWLTVAGGVGVLIGDRKELRLYGLVLGLLLGPIGWLVVGLSRSKFECPECEGDVTGTAIRCRHCGADLRVVPDV